MAESPVSRPWTRCYIGLGSNLENPVTQVTTALLELQRLDNCRHLIHSSLYRSDPVGPPGQPDYINAVASLETSLSPLELLDALQALEQQHQRIRVQHWGPRTLDLDLLLYGDQLISNERLTVPHPYLHERNFVLYPLAEINPDLTIAQQKSLAECIKQCEKGTLERI
ncbi:2-amino-4-hydroxy-6-hydroxymethyldihydropteridine diphosphokinase [Amphritea pacifica]|uniref:2-amino-4-hydroxy-6-hydroxymethyldihydropteridine pyrophosphokinase n=1 Tax=Amphritea pacifica TaxID=2811233 RepID=A0ABS2WBV9_9GAMM|nr:2-amino-4-hydroxy-6-hydroxymethyldihydropteridine diphosphokinase [Amphritea pacifica]MBN0989198.1 2-amino-4-hydroxy-6-hydroxymethyldihydropteridine diphosphokinase [Amphritea pacifica]MBN1008571.1 2-amino-4-hydroxy-6-hydroxymethyldihydropteridine diphosphokinase [Amphritea pacifica]